MFKCLARIRGSIYRSWCKLFNSNIHIGNGLLLYRKVKIEGPGQVYIGNNCTIGGITGDPVKYVTIDTHDPDAVITIGNNAHLYAARISSAYQITIGDDILIEESGIVDTDFHAIDREREDPIHETAEKCRILIGNNVCIGAYSILTKGVVIEDNVVIMPGSVVSKLIKANSRIGGNPARPVR